MTQETSSPAVVPALTKTDARELKSLVKNDTRMLKDELDTRLSEFRSQINQAMNEELQAVKTERIERNEEDEKLAERAMKRIQGRINTLNEAIIKQMTEMSEEGWTYYNGGQISPHGWTVELSSQSRHLTPPARDNSDLDEREETIRTKYNTLLDEVWSQYNQAERQLDQQEASVTRELTLQSITTEKAQEFILNMPDDICRAPAQLI